MKNKIILGFFILTAIFSSVSFAGSPNYVDENASGRFYKWKDAKIEVWFDPGPLNSSVNSADAQDLVKEAWDTWENATLKDPTNATDIPVKSVNFIKMGVEGADINVDNFDKYWNYESGSAAMSKDRHTVIIFDSDGKILASLGLSGLLGVTDIFAKDQSTGYIYNGTIIINGETLALDQYKDKDYNLATLIHELGHLMNLDHSAINEECAGSDYCGAGEGGRYLPTMFWQIIDGNQRTLHYDDKAWASFLYNFQNSTSNIRSKFCFVRGEVYDAFGRGFQGAQITVREQGDPYDVALTSITGSFYPACAEDDEDRNPGSYVITGLRPGKKYLIEYGPIPDFCKDQSGSKCSLGSGINPYVPPRDLDSGQVVTKNGETEFSCEKGGDILYADYVQLSADLNSDEYKKYSDLGFECKAGFGRSSIGDDEGTDEGGSSGKIFPKGWCSLVSGAVPGLSFGWLIVPVVLFGIIRRRYR